MPTPTDTWDATFEGLPPSGEQRSLGDDRIRDFKKAVSERANPEHHFDRLTTEDFSGEHRMGSARICRGTKAQRLAMQIDARTTDILPGTTGHEGGITDVVKVNNPNGLWFYEEDTGLVYEHNGTAWVLVALKADYANALSNLDADALLTLATTFRTPAVAAFRVKSPTTAGKRVDVRRGLYVDGDGTVREYAGNTDFVLAASPGAGDDRIDLLYLSGATLTELQGAAGATPRTFPTHAPAIPAGAFPLAYVYRRDTDTAFNEIDAGGQTAYLLRDMRGIVTRPFRSDLVTQIDDASADESVPASETVRITTSYTPQVGNKGVWFIWRAPYDLLEVGSALVKRLEARLYLGVTLKDRDWYRVAVPDISGTTRFGWTLHIAHFEPAMAASPVTVEIRDIDLDAGAGTIQYAGSTAFAGRLLIKEIF